MKNRVKLVDEYCFLGETESGHTVVMDGSVENGGRDRGVRPLELLLIGAAGCMFYDIAAILRKSKQDLRDGWIEIDYKREEDFPKIYKNIHFHIVLIGKSLKAAAVEKAIALSAEKYCSASIMLAKSAEMTNSYEIRELE